MPLKSSAVLFCRYNSFSGLPTANASPGWITSSNCLASRPSTPPRPRDGQTRTRSYATVNDNTTNPFPWPKTPDPTPYEILHMRKSDPYTKHVFYELVKRYHPDRHSHPSSSSSSSSSSSPATCLSKPALLERYRLVIAAHTLLSSPSARRLYDLYAVGWTGDRAPTPNEAVRHAERAWRDRPGNAAHNATWEDWERWHETRDGKPREPLYVSNGFFATMVVLACMAGAFAQMSRVETSGAEYLEMKHKANVAIGRDVARTTLVATGRTKDERVDHFLRDRENLAFAFSPARYESVASEQEQQQQQQQPGGQSRP